MGHLNGWDTAGEVPHDQTVRLTFWVKQTHTDDLEHVLARVSDPTSPDYGKYLSKAQIDAMTAPTSQDINVVKDALQGKQFEIRNGGSIIAAKVTIGFAEKLLGGD